MLLDGNQGRILIKLLKKMDKNTKESLYHQVNEMMDLLSSGNVHHVKMMLEGLRKEIQDGIYD
jgi:hypothetical protein